MVRVRLALGRVSKTRSFCETGFGKGQNRFSGSVSVLEVT